MPYADPSQQRQAQRDWWKSEYDKSPAFRRKELRRKKAARAAWSSKRKAKNREYMREFMRTYRAKLKKKTTARTAKTATRTSKSATRTAKAVKRTRTKARAPRRAGSSRGGSRRRD